MRRELANGLLKAKIKIKQIGGFTKSLSEYGRVWAWIAYLLKLIPNMNLKISNSKIVEHFIFFFLNPHCAFACLRWRGSRGDDHEISSYLHSERYQNINLGQIKNRDTNVMITYLIFNQNCNMVVFGLEFRFLKFENIFYPYTPCICMHAVSRGEIHEISSYLHSKSYQNINLDQIKNRDINLMITYLIFNQNCNFLATHVDARSWNCDFLLSSVDSSQCAAKWQTRFWKFN